MAMIFNTSVDNIENLAEPYKLWAYNAFDVCITHDVHTAQAASMDASSTATYKFARAMQTPALEMMMRGILVDAASRSKAQSHYSALSNHLSLILNRMAEAVWGAGLNPQSPKQLQTFFYKVMRIPPVISYSKGERKISTDRDALEKLKAYFFALPFVNLILAIRDCNKKLSVLTKGISEDGRIRTSYNVCGTETGRWSSSTNAFGEGDNLQNWNDYLKRLLIADPGKRIAYIDLAQAESRLVGLIVFKLFGDSTYLDACESSDLHTTVCRMVWQQLAWTGDLAHDKDTVAGQTFYRDFTYRDMSKRGGHGTNYYGQSMTMAKNLKVDKAVMERFQDAYFAAFPGIRRWHVWVKEQIQTNGYITTLLGRRRWFLGHRNADSTLREAIAHEPQSTIGDLLNMGMYQVQRDLPEVQLLAQIHDAIAVQYPEEIEDEIIPKLLSKITVTITVAGREFSIPADAQVGWNLGKYVSEEKGAKNKLGPNLDGLISWGKPDARQRQKIPQTSLLDFRLS